MASLRTNKGAALALTAFIAGKTFKAVLLDTGYTPSKDHNFVSDINANELSGTGYTAGFGGSGRHVLDSVAVVEDDTNDYAFIDCADEVWSTINAGTVGFVAIIEEITNDAASPVYAIIDVTPDVATNGGDYTWIVDAFGWWKA